jgi:hypothetical protein
LRKEYGTPSGGAGGGQGGANGGALRPQVARGRAGGEDLRGPSRLRKKNENP